MYFSLIESDLDIKVSHLNYNGYGKPIVTVYEIDTDGMYERRLYSNCNKELYINFKGKKVFLKE